MVVRRVLLLRDVGERGQTATDTASVRKRADGDVVRTPSVSSLPTKESREVVAAEEFFGASGCVGQEVFRLAVTTLRLIRFRACTVGRRPF